ncbi:MAG: hypothetical protein EXQ56_06450 [Acidobacteria bacterium]|nr:hypothetical protein [Acidobacteriota bacterium]
MSNVRLVQMKFQPDKKQIWLDWCEQLENRSEEVIQALKNEGVITEACFLSEDGNSILYFMEISDLEKEKAAVKSSTFKIDSDHRDAKLQSLERGHGLIPLFHFENRDSK